MKNEYYIVSRITRVNIDIINWNHCIYLGLHDIISSYFAFSMSDSSDYYEEPSTDEEASAPRPSVSAAAPAQSSSASSAVSSGSASALSASVVPATSAASSSGSSSSEPVARPSRPDTSVPVGSPVVSVPQPGRRPAGVLLPGELRDPGAETFMGIYNRGELGQLENWVEQSRRTRPYAGFMVGHPPIPVALPVCCCSSTGGIGSRDFCLCQET